MIIWTLGSRKSSLQSAKEQVGEQVDVIGISEERCAHVKGDEECMLKRSSHDRRRQDPRVCTHQSKERHVCVTVMVTNEAVRENDSESRRGYGENSVDSVTGGRCILTIPSSLSCVGCSPCFYCGLRLADGRPATLYLAQMDCPAVGLVIGLLSLPCPSVSSGAAFFPLLGRCLLGLGGVGSRVFFFWLCAQVASHPDPKRLLPSGSVLLFWTLTGVALSFAARKILVTFSRSRRRR